MIQAVSLRDEVSGVEVVRDVKFAQEVYSEKLIQEMRPLWDGHAADVRWNDGRIDPDLGLYSRADKAGHLRIYTARLGPLLVGYQVFWVVRHLHRNSLEACQDILYMDPEVRLGMAAYKFIKWCDECLIKEGVKKITHQVSAAKNISPIFKRMGYQVQDITYSRRI